LKNKQSTPSTRKACAGYMNWCVGAHEVVRNDVKCLGAHGLYAVAHEGVLPVQILQFSSLFRVFFRLAMPWNLKWILFNLYCFQRPF